MTQKLRLLMIAGAVISAGMMAGCPAPPVHPGPTTIASSQPQSAKSTDAPTLGDGPLARGVFLPIDTRQPLTGESLVKARFTRDQVLSAVKAKLVGSAAATTPAAASTARPDDEPAPQAVKDYLRGRQLFLEGKNTEALSALEDAIKLDPNGFTVLRLMGRVSFAAQQLARGATYLERAAELHPHDVEVNYLLGRYWLERNDPDKSAFYLMRAGDSPERLMTSTQTPLSSFYLAIALQQGGFHFAAAREFERFLEIAELPIAGYRYDGEMNYLLNMQWAIHLSAAENDARVGGYHTALPHYRAAAGAHPEDPFIASRLVNALAHDGQRPAAQQAAMGALVSTRASDDALRLLAWSYQGQQKKLIDDLTAFLQGKDGARVAANDSQKTIILAAAQDFLGDHAASMATFQRHLDAHPADLPVLTRLLKKVDTAAGFDRALRASAGAIAADPRRTDDVLREFMPLAEGPLVEPWEKLPPRERTDLQVDPAKNDAGNQKLAAFFAAVDYLHALIRIAHSAPGSRIEQAFDAALQWTGRAGIDFSQPRDAYVGYLIAHEKFARATPLIEAALKENPNRSTAWTLQIESEATQQRYLNAQQLALEARAKFPADMDLRMKLVSILRIRGAGAAADAELQSIINDKPSYEPAYRQLINSILAQLQRDPQGNLNAVVALLNKLGAAVPESRFGRVMSALIYARTGRTNDAETLLRTVLAAEPNDPDALVLQANIWHRNGRTDQAIDLLNAALQRKAQPDVVRALAGIYSDANRKSDALALARDYMDKNPRSDAFAILYADELITQDRKPDAILVAADALKKIPQSQDLAVLLARLRDNAGDHDAAVQTMRSFIQTAGETTDRLYLLAHFYSAAGNDDASTATLQRVLAIMPDHIGANNDLGYFWANAGIRLDQAEPMIKKAVENKPDDPAFIDSLGWLYYKQGKFADARLQLERAISLPGGASAEGIQHLGDTLYRLGKTQEAIDRWAQAREMLGSPDKLSPDDKKESQYLSAALAAARAGKEPALSPLADSPGTKAAGPAGTMPK